MAEEYEPTPVESAQAVDRYMKKHGALEKTEDQDKAILSLWSKEYIEGLDEAKKKQLIRGVRQQLSSQISKDSISEIDEQWYEYKCTKTKYSLKHIWLYGVDKTFPLEWLRKRKIKPAADHPELEDEEAEADGRNSGRGQKRKARISLEEYDDLPKEKQLKIRGAPASRTTPIQNSRMPSTPSKMPIRTGTPTPSRVRQDSATPQVDQIAMRKAWAKEAGLGEEPRILPTQKPVNPNEILPASDAVWTRAQMDDIFKDLFDATIAVFQEYNINEDAKAILVPNPGTELAGLYEILFATKDWAQLCPALQNQHENLNQGYMVMALIGAAIQKWIFKKDLEWDFNRKTSEALGWMEKYFKDTIADFGHDYETFLKLACGKQTVDPEFHEEAIVPRAHTLAEDLAAVLGPHLNCATRNEGGLVGSGKRESWMMTLQDAFQRALHLRLRLDNSELGPFQYQWSQPQKQLNDEHHAPVFKVEGATQILIPVLPAVLRKLDRELKVFSKVRVIAMAPAALIEPSNTEQ